MQWQIQWHVPSRARVGVAVTVVHSHLAIQLKLSGQLLPRLLLAQRLPPLVAERLLRPSSSASRISLKRWPLRSTLAF